MQEGLPGRSSLSTGMKVFVYGSNWYVLISGLFGFLDPILMCVLEGSPNTNNKHFSDTGRMSENSVHFWHYLPGDSTPFHRFKAQSPKGALHFLQVPTASPGVTCWPAIRGSHDPSLLG